MPIHSKFVVHWTGHDFHPQTSQISRSIREQYVERLRDDCLNGLFMKPGEETIHGRLTTSIKATISRICFSEVRLSQAEDHARQYGRLGIGFHRDFILERMGNPVLYVQNGDNGVLIEILHKVNQFLSTKEADKLTHDSFKIVLGYLKNMSYQNDQKLDFYEEMEWRIVHLTHLMGNYIKDEDPSQYFYRLTAKPEDIKIIVFPDNDTMKMAVMDSDISGFFNQNFPMMTTLADCNNF